MATTVPSTLRERIAALENRSTSPQPTPSARSQTPTSPPKAGGAGLRDKIARFEQKGGTPIPRGSFGLGAPPLHTTKRNNELWGNRIPSTGRSSSTGLGHSSSLSVGIPAKSRRVSMADAQLTGLQEELRAASGLEDIAQDSDLINSLDIARSPTSPAFSPTSPSRQKIFGSEKSTAASGGASQAMENTPSVPIPPPSSQPPIIVIREEEEDEQDLAPASTIPIEDSSEASTPIDDPDITSSPISEGMEGDSLLTPTLQPPSSLPAIIAEDSRSPMDDGVDTLEVSSAVAQEQIPSRTLGEAKPSVDPILNGHTSPAPEALPLIHEDSVRISSKPPSASSPSETLTSSLLAESVHAPIARESMPTSSSNDLLFSSTPQSNLTDAEEAADRIAPFELKGTRGNLDDNQHTVHHKDPSHPSDSFASISTSSIVTLDPPVASNASLNLPQVLNLAVSESAPHSPTTSDPRLSVASSEASCDSPPRVTPILDAFPAVPKYLPPSSLPARAHTISGRHRTVTYRNSASSTSSIKSTPSLSFSSTTSSSSSPTSSTLSTSQASPVFQRPAAGLQRSKSQRSRPISSVPAWYEDDSDDGEAGWANVVVTTRRY